MKFGRPPTQLKIALPLVFLAALANALMILLVKIAAASLTIPLILFTRYLIALIIVVPLLYYNKQQQQTFVQRIKTQRFPLHFLRDIFGFLGVYAYFYATKYMTLADATVLFNTSPLFIPFIAFFWQKLTIFHRLWFGIIIGFFGVVLMLHPGREIIQIAAIIGLFSGFCSALVIVAGRLLTYSEPPTRTLFYYFLVGTLLSLIVLLFQDFHFWHNIGKAEILLLLGIGIFSYLYQFFITTSTKYAPVRLSSSLLYVTVIFSLIFDWLIWDKIPDLLSALGILLIIFGAILLVLLYPQQDYKKHQFLSGK